MKIAYVCQSYPPMVSGAALVIQRLVEGIAARGHAVMVLTASDRGEAYIQNDHRIKIVRMTSFRNPLRVDQNFVFWPYDEVCQLLERFKPDILHTHDPLNFGLSAVRAAQRIDVCSVFTIHQLPWFLTNTLPLPQRMEPFVEKSIWSYSKWFLNQCTALVTPSQMIAEIVQAQTGFLPQTISNGVDLNLFTPYTGSTAEPEELCKKYGLCPDRPVMLYVGRIDPDKKVDRVIRAAAKVIHAVDAQLFVVGDGTHRKALIELSQSLGIRQNCFFPGFISKHGDLPGIYRLASVFLTASEVEIQSSVVLEAAASGLPVVAMDASSMPEFIHDGETGFLVPPGDLETMAERLIALVEDPPRARRMGKAARGMVTSHSNQRFVAAHEELYKVLIQVPVGEPQFAF